jgi:hypothetical protein
MSHVDIRVPIMAAVALVTGPVLFWRGFRHIRVCRLIENTPTARIRSMAMGLVELNGKVEARSDLIAPFSGKRCAHWQVQIAVRGKRKGSWTVVHRNHSGNPFFLQDDTGIAMVFPEGSDCRIRFGTDEECSGFNLPEVYADYVRENPGALNALNRYGWLRFRERTLEDGMQVYILGTATPRSRAIVVSEGEALAATGTDDLGGRQRNERDHAASAVVRQGENESTFIISQESERDIVFGLKTKAVAMIWGGPLLGLLGLAYWLYVLVMGHWLR